MRHFDPRIDVLPSSQRALWDSLAGIPALGFVLYGGTAIALRLGHRQSVDFDFFSNAPLDRAALNATLPVLSRSTVVQDVSHTLSVIVHALEDQPVKLSFFGNLRLGRVGEPERTSDDVLAVASLDDLFALKLAVIGQRVAQRDYIDIATMIRQGMRLEQGLASAKALYGSQFQPSEAVKVLTYFEEGDFGDVSEEDRQLLRSAAGKVRELPTVSLASEKLSN